MCGPVFLPVPVWWGRGTITSLSPKTPRSAVLIGYVSSTMDAERVSPRGCFCFTQRSVGQLPRPGWFVAASSLQAVSVALATGTHGARRGEDAGLGLGAVPDLGQSIDEATDEAEENGRHAGDGDGGVEEDKAGNGDGQLVESAHHRIGG